MVGMRCSEKVDAAFVNDVPAPSARRSFQSPLPGVVRSGEIFAGLRDSRERC